MVKQVSPIESSRFSIDSEKPLGRGAWGEVYAGKDNLLGHEVAIKVLSPTPVAEKQAEYRKLNGLDAMKKEAVELAACSRIAPRRLELDSNGRPFIVMPLYKRGTLADRLRDNTSSRVSLKSGNLSQEEIYGIIKDSAQGLAETHTILNIAHQDIKPDNMLLSDSGEVHISDFGTSTFLAYGINEAPRDNMGHVHTRAPECFRKGSHPTARSDVWAFGSLAYRLFSGKYIFEDEINASSSPEDFFNSLDSDSARRIIKKKLASSVPREFRKFLEDCLSLNEYSRPQNGVELVKRTNDAIRYRGFLGSIKRNMKTILGSAALGAFLAAGIYGAATHEPKELKMPEIRVKGETRIGNLINEEVKFEQESVPYPKPTQEITSSLDSDPILKRATDNIQVAYLTRAYISSMLEKPAWSRDVNTEHQQAMFSAYVSQHNSSGPQIVPPYIRMIALSIEDALTRAKNPDGLVDLEDACVITRLGPRKLDEARKAAKSFDYRDYIDAKDIYGHRIIPEKEKEIIDIWRGYINRR